MANALERIKFFGNAIEHIQISYANIEAAIVRYLNSVFDPINSLETKVQNFPVSTPKKSESTLEGASPQSETEAPPESRCLTQKNVQALFVEKSVDFERFLIKLSLLANHLAHSRAQTHDIQKIYTRFGAYDIHIPTFSPVWREDGISFRVERIIVGENGKTILDISLRNPHGQRSEKSFPRNNSYIGHATIIGSKEPKPLIDFASALLANQPKTKKTAAVA